MAEGKDTGEGVTPWTPKVREKFETKSKSEFLDPCQETANRSIRCLHRNGGDRSLCQDYFQAYRDCKKLWVRAVDETRRMPAEYDDANRQIDKRKKGL